MRIHGGWSFALLATALAGTIASSAEAQYKSFYPSGGGSSQSFESVYGAPSGPSPYAQQAFYGGPPASGPTGPTAAQLEGLYGPAPGGYGPGAGGYGSDDMGYGSDAGCEDCAGGNWLGLGSGGCPPRTYNVHADYMSLWRSNARNTAFSSDGILGPTALETDDLSFSSESGFRITGRIDVGVYSTLEASYFGAFDWNSSAEATSANDNLYSLYSDFGIAPPGGFNDVDQAARHSIQYNSKLDNAEMNLRRAWTGAMPGIQGSWMIGVRYFRLKEQFDFFAQVNEHEDPFNPPVIRGPASTQTYTSTTNNLIGVQIGGDLWACVLPRFMIGADLKLGLYGNEAKVSSTVDATSLGSPFFQETSDTNAAFIGEANFMAVYELTSNWTIRGGYQLLFVDGVALAPENFNSSPPFVSPTAPLVVNDNGDVFYHGFTAGLEWNY